MNTQSSCRMSFIVPAYNEAKLLGATLDAIRGAAALTGESFEIIVVDDDSSDETASIAAGRGARVLAVRNRSIARTRNDGARQARGEYLFFVDADTLIDQRVLRAALSRLHAGDVGGGAVFKWDNAYRRFGRLLEVGVDTLLRRLNLASGCFMYASRQAFEAVGGFDGSLFASEEWSLSRALARIGPFRVLQEPVITSGRKLASMRLRDVLMMLLRAALRGPRSLKEREYASMWYRDPPR